MRMYIVYCDPVSVIRLIFFDVTSFRFASHYYLYYCKRSWGVCRSQMQALGNWWGRGRPAVLFNQYGPRNGEMACSIN